MEIKKKGNKWVAVDGDGIVYTHQDHHSGRYSSIIGKANGKITHVISTTSNRAISILCNSEKWYKEHYKPIEPPKPFWHKYGVDQKVLVRDSDSEKWKKRYYHGVSRDGKTMTYINGATSWSTDTSELKYFWEQIKDVETGEVWKAN